MLGKDEKSRRVTEEELSPSGAPSSCRPSAPSSCRPSAPPLRPSSRTSHCSQNGSSQPCGRDQDRRRRGCGARDYLVDEKSGAYCNTRNVSGVLAAAEEGALPPPPPRGKSSAQTVQALSSRMRKEPGTPESRRQLHTRHSQDNNTCSCRNNTCSYHNNTCSCRSNTCSCRNNTCSCRSNICTKRHDRDRDTIPEPGSPNASVRSEGDGRSLFNADDRSHAASNGGLQRAGHASADVRTPILRSNAKLYKSLNSVPVTSDHDITYLKDELITRLLKERELLLELRKRKQSQRERLQKYRNVATTQQNITELEEFERTAEPRARLQALDRTRYYVCETPEKTDDEPPESSKLSPESQHKLANNLRSDVATQLLFSSKSSDVPTPNGPFENQVPLTPPGSVRHTQGAYPGSNPQDFPRTPTRHLSREHPALASAGSCPVDFRSPTAETSTRPSTVLSHEVSSFNERAVDCPVDNAFLRKSMSLDYHRKKLSPPGCDVIRSVDRANSPETAQLINPVLMAPYRRKTKKSKDNKDKCNTQ